MLQGLNCFYRGYNGIFWNKWRNFSCLKMSRVIYVDHGTIWSFKCTVNIAIQKKRIQQSLMSLSFPEVTQKGMIWNLLDTKRVHEIIQLAFFLISEGTDILLFPVLVTKRHIFIHTIRLTFCSPVPYNIAVYRIHRKQHGKKGASKEHVIYIPRISVDSMPWTAIFLSLNWNVYIILVV